MKRTTKCLVLGVIILATLVVTNVPATQAFSWSEWYTAAVGDVSEAELSNHWYIWSEPKSGYESELWDDWEDVTWSLWDQDSNLDKEIRISTYDDATYMGVLYFQSKGEFSGTDKIHLVYRVARRYTHTSTNTLGKIQIWDITSQTVTKEWLIRSAGTSLSWVKDGDDASLNPSHTYAIRLVFNDAWKYQRVEVIFEYVEVWGFYTDSFSWSHYEYWIHQYIWPAYFHHYISQWEIYHSFSQFDIDDMLRNHIPYGRDRGFPPGVPTGWNPAYVLELRVSPRDHVSFWAAISDLPEPRGYGAEQEGDEWEVEVYTYNAEALQPDYSYYASVALKILEIGQI